MVAKEKLSRKKPVRRKEEYKKRVYVRERGSEKIEKSERVQSACKGQGFIDKELNSRTNNRLQKNGLKDLR